MFVHRTKINTSLPTDPPPQPIAVRPCVVPVLAVHGNKLGPCTRWVPTHSWSLNALFWRVPTISISADRLERTCLSDRWCRAAQPKYLKTSPPCSSHPAVMTPKGMVTMSLEEYQERTKPGGAKGVMGSGKPPPGRPSHRALLPGGPGGGSRLRLRWVSGQQNPLDALHLRGSGQPQGIAVFWAGNVKGLKMLQNPRVKNQKKWVESNFVQNLVCFVLFARL